MPSSSSTATAEVANSGWFRPPLIYLLAILSGIALAIVRPLPLLPGRLGGLPGGVCVVAALALFGYAVKNFRASGTPVPGDLPTTAIVRSGPYRFTRNPIYLAFSLLQLGIAMWLNSLWLIATLAAAIAVIAGVVVPREERYLEEKFGSDYLQYTASVRRWL